MFECICTILSFGSADIRKRILREFSFVAAFLGGTLESITRRGVSHVRFRYGGGRPFLNTTLARRNQASVQQATLNQDLPFPKRNHVGVFSLLFIAHVAINFSFKVKPKGALFRKELLDLSQGNIL